MLVCKIQSHVQKKNNKQSQRTKQNIQRQKKITGRVKGAPEYVTQFIENALHGPIVTTHPDKHYVRRAIEKIWNLHSGQVIQYLATKFQKMLDQELATQWEPNVEWYKKTANRPRDWREIK